MVIRTKTQIQKGGAYGIDIVIGKIVAKLIIKVSNHGIKHFAHNQLELMYHPEYFKEIANKVLNTELLNDIKRKYNSFFKELNVQKLLRIHEKVLILNVDDVNLHKLRNYLRREYEDPVIIMSGKNIEHIDLKHVANIHYLKDELEALLTNYLHNKKVESQECVEVITNAVSRGLKNEKINQYRNDALTEEDLKSFEKYNKDSEEKKKANTNI